MGIEVRAIGGYGEIGKNMTAIKIDNDVIIIDMGIHLPNYINITEEEDLVKISTQQLINAQAIPDDSIIADWKNQVRAIIPSHAHLDHIGAIPYLAAKYNAPIIASPFTLEVIKRILSDEHIHLPNELIVTDMNKLIQLTTTLAIQLIEITHSTPHSCLVVLHTPYGAIVYANDFKLDNTPIIGKKPPYQLLESIGNKGVALLISECLYAPLEGKTPSESVARQMLQEVMLSVNSKGKAIIVTTFSSHIARLKSIVEFSRKLNRKVVFLGRSLSKYVEAAIACGLIHFDTVEIVKYPKHVAQILTKINKKRDKYVIVATGHQGEPKSVLHRMTHGVLPFTFKTEDHIIFSCKVIPTQINEQNRAELEADLKKFGVRIFKDVHVSGHASKEDLRDLLKYLKPQHLIPSHGGHIMMDSFHKLSDELGYHIDQTIHPMNNGETLRLT
ncbi:MAG: RNase J family beta-CASP ribonuclease [Nanoarchaeota archaeon]